MLQLLAAALLLVAALACQPLIPAARCATDQDCPDGTDCNHVTGFCVTLVDVAAADGNAIDVVNADLGVRDRALADVSVGADQRVADSGSADLDSSEDAQIRDRAALDAGAPDQSVPDAPSPEGPIQDALYPDTAAPDTAAPDSADPDAAAPDTSAPDTAAPDSTAPDAAAQDASLSTVRRLKLIIDNRGNPEPLTDFPVLVRLDPNDVAAVSLSTTGDGIAFYDQEVDAALSFEIERWSQTATSYIWVRVPQITADSNTRFIWLYYGLSADVVPPPASDVWDPDFLGVWHLHQDSNSTSTSSLDFVSSASSSDAEGQIHMAQQFSEGTEGISTPDDSAPIMTGDLTASAWVAYDSLLGGEDGNPIISAYYVHGATATYPFYFAALDSGALMAYWNDSPQAGYAESSEAAPLGAGVWHHLAMTRADGELLFYCDGEQLGAPQVFERTTADRAPAVWLGADPFSPSTTFTDGRVDDARISSIARSPGWIRATYRAGTGAMVVPDIDEPSNQP